MRPALIVVDNGDDVAPVERGIAAAGFEGRAVFSTSEASRVLAGDPPDLLVVRSSLLGEDGVEFAEAALRQVPGLRCLVVAPDPNVPEAVRSMRTGAEGYLPVDAPPEQFVEILCRRRSRVSQGGQPSDEPDFVAGSASMQAVMSKLRRVAPLDTTVLLGGESGSGKEVAARYLHDHHPRRRGGPFVCLHCGAMPDGLLESELFGHVKGAFTGADRDRIGKFEQASGGTLFLDEIATMKPESQVRLLRVLQERRVTRVGSTESRPVDVRVIVASNQDLRRLVAEGAFRLDLFYRVSAFPVSLPPLRERVSDIPAMAELFARRTAARIGLDSSRRFAPATLKALAAHAWPGNVRELENAVEYATILAEDGTILPEHLPEEISPLASDRTPPPASVIVTEDGISFRSAVTYLERDLILQSMRLADGNKARAAELLDLKRTTFLEKLRRLEDEGLISAPQPDRSNDDLGAADLP